MFAISTNILLLTVVKFSSAHANFDTSFAYGVSRQIYREGRMITRVLGVQ
jgi:hypothetical protein